MVVRAAIEETSRRISVGKVKAHRNFEDVAKDDLEDWLGNECADEWA